MLRFKTHGRIKIITVGLAVSILFSAGILGVSHVTNWQLGFTSHEVAADSRPVVQVNNWTDLQSAINTATEPTIVELTANISSLAPLIIPSGANIALTGNFTLSTSGDHPVIHVDTSTFTLDGPTITRTGINNAPNTRGILVESGTLTMISGSVTGHHLGLGGTITTGGGVHVSHGTFTIHGGSITNNISTLSGGGIALLNSSLHIRGGAINYNTSTDGSGGGIFGYAIYDTWQSTTLTIYGNTSSQINNNIAALDGGGISIRLESDIQIDNPSSQINNNIAGRDGGGIHIYGGASRLHAGHFYTAGSLYLASGEISGNKAGNHGGGIMLDDEVDASLGWFSPHNIVVSNNTAGGDGGGIAITTGMYIGQLSIRRNTIIKNNTATNGGAIAHLHYSSGLYLDGGKIVNNTATQNGGALLITEFPPWGVFPVGIYDAVVFNGNRAHQAHDYGLAQGIIDHPFLHISHHASLGVNSIIGTSLLNNYDINFTGNPIPYHVVSFMTTPTETFFIQPVINNVPMPPLHQNPLNSQCNTFLGWHGLNSQLWNFSTPIVANTTLLAHWDGCTEVPGVPDTGFARLHTSRAIATILPALIATIAIITTAKVLKTKRQK